MQDDQLKIGSDLGADRVRGLFDTIAAGYQPPLDDLVPSALASARRATRRRALAYSVGAGALAAVGSLALVLGETGTTARATPAGGGTAEVSAAKGQSAIDRQCTGTYLPWSGGSDASLYGKGSNAQRTTICEQDLAALAPLLPGFSLSQSTQPYGSGVQDGEFMPDQIAEMGSGMKADTPVLGPWQYDATAHGHTDIINIEYSRDTIGIDLCDPCNGGNKPLTHGFRLVHIFANSAAGQPASGVQLKTPQGETVQIFISVLGPDGVQKVDPVKLVEKPAFADMLAADLAIIGNN